MRTLKIAVVVMGIMLIVGFFALIAVVAGRVANKQKVADSVAAPFAAPAIELPAGGHIETMAVGPDRLVLNLLLAGGERQLVIVDLATGQKLGTVPLVGAK